MKTLLCTFLICGLLFSGFYFATHRSHSKVRSYSAFQEPTSITEQASLSQGQVGNGGSLKAGGSLRNAIGLAKPAASSKPGGLDPKMHLDLARIFATSELFKKANPQLTLEKILAQDFDINSVKLPAKMKLSYQFDPSCGSTNHPVLQGRALSERENKNLHEGAPTFLTREVGSATDLGQLMSSTASDPCIKGLSFDATGDSSHPADGSRIAFTGQVDPEQKQIADSAIAAAASEKQPVKLAVIGLRDELKGVDPGLLAKAQDGSYKSTPSAYVVTNPDNQAVSGAVITRRPFVVHPDASGNFTDSDVSNAIIHAADRRYAVINVALNGVNPADLQTAVDYAKQRGATVVFHGPIPPSPKIATGQKGAPVSSKN